MLTPNIHNRLVAGSNPAEPTSEPDSLKKSHVLPELLQLIQALPISPARRYSYPGL